MADLKALQVEMENLKKQIEKVISVSGYSEYDDLSGLDDFKQIKTADQRQQLEQYRKILYKLGDIQCVLAYHERPIIEVSKLHCNESGRYETDEGFYYTCGSGIEFLRTEEVYNSDSETWEDAQVWTTSSVESENGRYFIVGYPTIELSELTVRVRG